MTLTTILLSIGLIISIAINILIYKILQAQLKKIKLYEEMVVASDEWTNNIKSLVQSTYLKLKNVDNKNLFFKDDDVGFIFTELLDILKQLNDRIEQ